MKKPTKLMALALAALTIAPNFVACGDQGGIDIDPEKTQLYIGNYDGGMGHVWLDHLVKGFEEKYATTSFEKDKTGVQIIVENSKDLGGATLISTMSSKKNELYFTESAVYYEFINAGLLLDITDVLTTPQADDGNKTIESKMNDVQQAYFKTEEDKYYAVPHYAGYTGIIYDIDLFNEKELFIAKNGAPSEKLQDGGSFKMYRFTNAEGEKSAGPDGKYGTTDDGLPATYDEFFKLCDEMVKKQVTPFVYTGQYPTYTNWFLTALQADYEGPEELSAILNLDGSTAKDILKIQKSANGQYTDDRSGDKFNIVEAGDVELTNQNGYMMFAQKGKLEALRFMERVFSNPSYYYNSCIGSTFSHRAAQSAFLLNGIGTSAEQPIAFLLDGIWWEEEATADFEYAAAKFGSQYSKANRNIGLMPLPKADESKIGEGVTVMDLNKTTIFISSKIAKKKVELAKMFLAYSCSDEALRDFTTTTYCPKALTYDMGDDYDNLNSYGKNIWNVYKDASYMLHYSGNVIYRNALADVNIYASNTTDYSQHLINFLCPALAGSTKISAETAFKNIVEYQHHAAEGWKVKMKNYLK